MLLLASCRIRTPALVWGVALAAAIVFYDYRHKGRTLARS